jgi:hypothetical protein
MVMANFWRTLRPPLSVAARETETVFSFEPPELKRPSAPPSA